MATVTAVSALDEGTARAIRAAMAAAGSGRLAEACAIGERALADGGDAAALNAMLGTLHCRTGDLGAGVRHLTAANAARPADPVIALNLATALAETGEHARALAIATEGLARKDPSLRLERLRGFLAQTLEDYPTAIASYERVIGQRPDDADSWNNLGNALRGAGQFDAAVDALRRAVQLDSAAAPTRLNYGTALIAAGQAAEAEEVLRSMSADFPRDWRPLRELHSLYRALNREEDALTAIEQASQRAPDNLELLLAVASQRLLLLDNPGAEQAYRAAIAKDPKNPMGNLGVAVVFELTNRAADLAGWVKEVEARGVDEGVINFIRAFDHRRSKRYADGVAALSRVPDTIDTARRAFLWGQLNEGAGDFGEAWKGFERMNEIHRNDSSQPPLRGAAFRALVRSHLEHLTKDWAAGWTPYESSDGRPTPAFIVGFPRSGTTLLDTFLMGHPDALVLEEEPTTHAAIGAIGPFAELPKAPAERIEEARRIYFDTLDAIAQVPPSSLVIDKNPLLMTSQPIVKRLFPDARMVLALRHPCDAVLSCFATNFKLNEAMSSFLRLEDAAELYDLSFSLFERAQQLLPLPVHQVRYEDLIADREKELRAVSAFLGLDWTPDILDHQQTAQKRGRIKTASYAQVVEPIYTRSAGRWRNYRKQLEPVLPVLEPWVRKFGYEL